VAARLLHARLAARLSKEEAARRAGISAITWKRIEDGQGVQDAKLHAALSLLGIDAEAEVSPGDSLRTSEQEPPLDPVGRGRGSLVELVEARRKFAAGQPLADRERQLIHRWIEDQELATLPERLAALDRIATLAVSRLVDDLLSQRARDYIAEYGVPVEDGSAFVREVAERVARLPYSDERKREIMVAVLGDSPTDVPDATDATGA